MTFLPIVRRELLVTARRASTYWTRFIAAGSVMVIALILLVGDRWRSPAQLGHHIFIALGVLALGFSMLAGVFLTSDCLSEEKREGTLGLLFLTELGSIDVVLGKLAATSLHALFALLAVFPILGLPLLMGGTTGAEFYRLLLVLLTTLFLSLSVGMAISAISFEARQSIVGTLLVMMLLAGLCPALWWFQWISVRAWFLDFLLLPSPAFLFQGSLGPYFAGGGAMEFWQSICTILVLATTFMGLAVVALPRSWQQKESIFHIRRGLNWINLFRRRLKPSSGTRSRVGDGNPFLWLARRDSAAGMIALRVLRALLPLWCLFLLAAITTSRTKESFITCIFMAYGLHLIFKIIVAIDASRRMIEDRHSGALELLLVTPIPIPSIISGHQIALRAHFRRPFLLLLSVNLLLILFILFFRADSTCMAGISRSSVNCFWAAL